MDTDVMARERWDAMLAAGEEVDEGPTAWAAYKTGFRHAIELFGGGDE